MPEHLVDASLRQYSVPRQSITDTASPSIASVPSDFIHSVEQPFCADARCTCHAQQQEVDTLFVIIIEGHVQLEQAAALLVENRKEHRA